MTMKEHDTWPASIRTNLIAERVAIESCNNHISNHNTTGVDHA